MNSKIKNDVLSIISEIANAVLWNRYVNEHYLHHYFTYLLRKNEYKIDITKRRSEFEVHPEWPTFRKDDDEENIRIPYRRYLKKKIPDDEDGCSCGHIDFAIGPYNRPEIGVEFKWVYGWDKDTIGFDFLKCMDRALPFTTTISYSVITRKENLSPGKKKLNFEMKMNEAVKKARDHLVEKHSLYEKSKKDVYLIITEIGIKDKRHWYFDESQEIFIERPKISQIL